MSNFRIYFYAICIATAGLSCVVQAYMNLYLNQPEVMKLLGLSAELYYVREGQLNEYAMNFAVPVPDNVQDIAFTWQNLAGKPLGYAIAVHTSDPELLPNPTLNISAVGNVPMQPDTFVVSLRCTGVRSSEVEVIITIQVTLNRAHNNVTDLVFRRKKLCMERQAKSDTNENEHWLAEPASASSRNNPDGMTTFIVGSSLAGSLVVVLVVFAYCARNGSPAKRSAGGVHSKQLRSGNAAQRTSSFQRLSGCPQFSCPSSLVFPPAPVSHANLNDMVDYQHIDSHHHISAQDMGDSDDEQLLQQRIQEVTVQRCRVRLSNLLQEGTFGRVYRGTYNDNQPVIVKTVDQNANQSQVSVLLREGMSLWGVSHPGIQTILGVSVEDHIPPFLLFAAPHAACNLKLYLQEPAARSLTTIQIVQMATQLSLALEHLHGHGFVHRDIAARNCIVEETLNIRLGDCALARDLFPGDYSCLGDRENRPVKWLALEALTGKRFSEASDAWSFGVLMWEMCTLARQPYQEIVDDEMEQFLRDGFRLAQPVNCPDELFAIMAYCWALSPLERPTFAQLQLCLNDFYTQITRYI